jgi:phosphoglycolate phosphatase
MFKAVLFDLDGTLLDTLVDIANSGNYALAHFGFPAHPVDAYKYFVGDAPYEAAKRSLPESARDHETITKINDLASELYDRCWHENTRPYPDIPELLCELERRNLPMAILSNKPDHFTKAMVEKLLPDRPFKIVQGALPDVPLKPDPTSALQIAKQLKIPPEQFLYLGDTNTDMKTAVNADMFPVGCLWGFRTADELMASGAKVLVQKPAEVLGILDNQRKK